MTLLASLDLSSNRLSTLAHLRPLARLHALVSLRAAANPLALLPNYRRRVIALLPRLQSLDGAAVRPARPARPALIDRCAS